MLVPPALGHLRDLFLTHQHCSYAELEHPDDQSKTHLVRTDRQQASKHDIPYMAMRLFSVAQAHLLLLWKKQRSHVPYAERTPRRIAML